MRSYLNRSSELKKRVIAGSIGGFILISAVLYGEWTYFGVFFFICLFSLREFYKIVSLNNNLPLKTYGTINGVFLFSLSFLIEKNILPPKYYLLMSISLSAIYMIKLYIKRDKRPFLNIGFTFLGIAYVAIPFSLLNVAIFSNNYYNYEILIGFLFILWASDTGAFFAGKYLGKRKLFARVSPKKTWEGSIGGSIVALVVTFQISHYFSVIPVWQWFVVATIIIIAGTYGDLVESLLKRSIMIKDSGNSIPGHGGFLDRFDGLLIASPLIIAFIELIK